MDKGIHEVNENFYKKYKPHIRAVVSRILTDAGQACDIDDCVSIVFLELMEKLQRYNEARGSMAAFVTVIARSAALNYCRDNRRRIHELIGDDKIDFLSAPIEFEDNIEFEMLVKGIKEKLTEQETILFTMRYICYYTPDEIAKVFKIRRNTVDKRIGGT
jgi:RNA polymerase sigma factor (sigma-70 family)